MGTKKGMLLSGLREAKSIRKPNFRKILITLSRTGAVVGNGEGESALTKKQLRRKLVEMHGGNLR